jgi:hypothetical protein
MATNRNRAGLLTESSSRFPNNITQEISPADLRSWIADGTTSFVTQKDKSTLENAIYEARSTSLASAATTDLSLASGNYVHITGTTTITSFGTCLPGARFVLVFDGVLTLTYNATSLIIPGAANKTTAVGDACMIISEGSGNWKIVGYFAISGSGGGGGTGTVTSVWLTMPSAFSVANSPVTTAGTIAVTGAGLDSQYIRGDGTLANFPNSSGGGASVNYYLNGSVSQGTIGGISFRELNKTPIIGAGTNFSTSSNGYIQSFITDANDPNQLLIPAGNWNFETYFSASSGGGTPSFYVELYKWDGATLTLIASSSTNPEGITNGTTVDLYVTSLAVPATVLAATDRLAIRYYVNTSGRTITLHTEDNNLGQVITSFTTGLTALNGLTAQVQTFATGTSGSDFGISSATNTHTFNLPDASATARGVLTTGAQTLAGIKTFGNGASAGEIRLLEPSGSGSNYVAIKAQAMAADYSLSLPAAAGTAGDFLQYGTGGNLAWANPNPFGAYRSIKVAGLGAGANSTTAILSNSIYIPAGTFVAGDMMTIYARFFKSTASIARVFNNLIYINTANSLSGSPILLATAQAGAGQVNGELIREISVLSTGVSGQSVIKNVTTPNTDWNNYTLSSSALATPTINWSVDQYLIHALAQTVTLVTEIGYSYGLSITAR